MSEVLSDFAGDVSSDQPNYGIEYRGLSATSLAQEMATVRASLDEAKKVKSELQNRYDFIRSVALPKQMEVEGLDKFHPTGVDKGVRIQDELFVSVPKPNFDEFKQWLDDHGHGDLVIETVNASSLKAFINNCIKNGIPYPVALVKVTSVPTARFY